MLLVWVCWCHPLILYQSHLRNPSHPRCPLHRAQDRIPTHQWILHPWIPSQTIGWSAFLWPLNPPFEAACLAISPLLLSCTPPSLTTEEVDFLTSSVEPSHHYSHRMLPSTRSTSPCPAAVAWSSSQPCLWICVACSYHQLPLGWSCWASVDPWVDADLRWLQLPSPETQFSSADILRPLVCWLSCLTFLFLQHPSSRVFCWWVPVSDRLTVRDSWKSGRNRRGHCRNSHGPVRKRQETPHTSLPQRKEQEWSWRDPRHRREHLGWCSSESSKFVPWGRWGS